MTKDEIILKVQKDEGITLISLIITIILLIILAGVVINLLLSNNGILNRAKSASMSYEVSDIISRIQFDILDYQIENNCYSIDDTVLEKILSNYGEVIYNNSTIEKLITKEKKYEIGIDDIISSRSIYSNSSVLYCWDWEQSLSSNRDDFMAMCNELDITSVYFCFNPQNWTTYKEDTKTFIRTLSQKGISVLALNGDPSWFSDLNEIKKFTDTIVSYNNTVNNSERILGIVLDIEPGGTQNWATDELGTFKTYVETQKQLYPYAKNNGLLVIQCISYWFDDISIEALEDLVQNACDGISVMNFWKESSIDLIRNEMKLAEKYNKYIDSIANFIDPNDDTDSNNDTTSNTSFFNDGIDAAKENWNNMKKEYTYNKFGVAYHDYSSIKKMQGGTYTIEIYLNKNGAKVPNTNIKVINVNSSNSDIYTSTTTEGGYAVFWLTYGKTYRIEVEGYGIASINDNFSKQKFSFLKKDGTYFSLDAYIKDSFTTYNAEIYFKDSNSNNITGKNVTLTNVNDSSEIYTSKITDGGYISVWLKHGETYKVTVQDYTVTSGTFSYSKDVGDYKAFDVICK